MIKTFLTSSDVTDVLDTNSAEAFVKDFIWRFSTNNKKNFKKQFRDLKKMLLSLDETTRRELFLFISDREEDSERGAIILQIFQHPNFDVFETFLRDEICYWAFVWEIHHFLKYSDVRSENTLRKRFVKRYNNVHSTLRLYSDLLEWIFWKESVLKIDPNGNEIIICSQPEYEISEEKELILMEEEFEHSLDQTISKKKDELITDERKRIDNFKGYAFFVSDSVAENMVDIRWDVEECITLFDVRVDSRRYSDIRELRWNNCLDAMKGIFQSKKWPKFIEGAISITQDRLEWIVLSQPVIEWDQNKLDNVIAFIRRTSNVEQIESLREVRNDLLPIWIKLHVLEAGGFNWSKLNRWNFTAHNANSCFNLPPFGSIYVVEDMFERIEQALWVDCFYNPWVEIQVCTAGRLDNESAWILDIFSYYASDEIRSYKDISLSTSHNRQTYHRRVIYDAGVLDRWIELPWFNQWDSEQYWNHIGRTDVLWCKSLIDIGNVNIIASLLSQRQYWGPLQELWQSFYEEWVSLLERYWLKDLLEIKWVWAWTYNFLWHDSQAHPQNEYSLTWQKIEEIAFDEVERAKKWWTWWIIANVIELIDTYERQILAANNPLNTSLWKQ